MSLVKLRTVGLMTTAAAGLLVWAAVMAAAPAGGLAASGSNAPPVPVPAQAADDYVGQDTCLGCHDDKNYEGSPHAYAQNPRSPAAKAGCESCHGPGRLHVEGGGDASQIRNPLKLKASEVSETCTACHNRADHALWTGSQHDRRGLSCATCHSVHNPKSMDGQLVEATQLRLCANCHRDKVAKLDRSGHMPVREGKIQCSTCHNIHGSQNVRLLRVGNSVNESCASCHQEKRGPFLWEHAAVRENCASCHDPHGSANERLLVAKLPFLCQRCHAHTRHPATIYDNAVATSNTRVYGRSCVNCHAAIHGSNHPSGWSYMR